MVKLGLTVRSKSMRNLKRCVIPVLIATPLALLLAQCSAGSLFPVLVGKKIWLSNDEDVLKQGIRHHIRVGSSIAEAKNILHLNGFSCGYQKKSEPVVSIETNRSSKDGDYLFCYLEVSQLVCAKTYKSMIYYKNETVTNIDAAIGGWCL